MPSPGSGRRRRHGPARAHPTISRLAAGCPLSPRQRMGRSSGTSRIGRGASRRRIPPDTPAGTTPQGGGGGGGECVRQATRSPPPGQAKSGSVRGAGSREAASGRGERLQVPRQPVPTTSSAGQLLSSSPPHARQRGAARGAAEALTPPAPSAAAAAARTGGARGRRRRSSPWRLLPAAGFPRGQRERGVGLPSGVPGLGECVQRRTKSCGLRANHCNSKSCAA